MQFGSFIFSIDAPVGAGKGALFISNGTYREPGRTLDQYELIFVRKGCLRVEEGDLSYDVGPGQTAILAPGVYHQCREVSTEPLKQYWVRFTCPDSTNQTGSAKIYVPKVTTIASPDRLQQMWQMYMEEERHDPISQFTADLLVTLLLCEVAQAGSVVTESIGIVDALASQARIYIQEHFSEPISTSSIAYALDCNPNYLGRSFRKSYGKTITDYLYSIRRYYAHELLVYGRKSITEIAVLCGFGNRGYFRQVFVKHEGISPLAYRKRYGKILTNL